MIKNIIATSIFAIFCAFLMVLAPMISDGVDDFCVYEPSNYNSMDMEVRSSGYNFPLLCENQELFSVLLFAALAVGGAIASFMLGKTNIKPFEKKREMLGGVGTLIIICLVVNILIKETLPEFTPIVFLFSFLNLLFVQLGAYEKVIENKQVFQLVMFSVIVFIFLVLFLLLSVASSRMF